MGRHSKLEVLSHLHCGFIFRGLAGIHYAAYSFLQGGEVRTFESAIELLPGVLCESARHFSQRINELGVADADRPELGEMLIAGRSSDRTRIQAFRLSYNINDFMPVELERGVHLAPSPGAAVPLPKSMTIEQAIRAACAQRKMMAAQAIECGGGVGIGGHLQAMEITPDIIRIKTIHEF
ncbi:hypothetical protein P24_09901 [Oceanibaculum indicum P24]|uniref:Uncharacterized protein n=1 Tax=Oceanibaculum indicum P24 TaxID=1207063 RepID=K2KDZ5_9PROT|nr:hypothetical protein P24_09901 [Oceanibaculum indicum P24]